MWKLGNDVTQLVFPFQFFFLPPFISTGALT